VTALFDEVCALAASLPRSTEAIVRDRRKFRIGRIVWLAFSRDESIMGFAFPKEQRDGLIASAPDVFFLPRPSELRYNWVESRLEEFEQYDRKLALELVVDGWAMCVPRRVSRDYLDELRRTP
jgi:hypothetical protein